MSLRLLVTTRRTGRSGHNVYPHKKYEDVAEAREAPWPYYYLFYTMLFSGLRRSEALGLTKVISQSLGHANIGITLDSYAHLLPGMSRTAAERFEELLKPWLSKKEDGGKSAIR